MLNINPHQLSTLIAKRLNALIIDVRFGSEREESGLIFNSCHVPLYTPDWDTNPEFIKEVSAIANKKSPIIVICRNGNRSCDACDILEANGYKEVYNLQQGYNGLISLISPNNQGEPFSFLEVPSIAFEIRIQ